MEGNAACFEVCPVCPAVWLETDCPSGPGSHALGLCLAVVSSCFIADCLV